MSIRAELDLSGSAVVLRDAIAGDVAAIVELLADDPLGTTRESVTTLQPYLNAFELIEADPAHVLIVGTAAGQIVSTLQLTIVPLLARRAASRGQLEAIRVRADYRSLGLGAAMITWAVDEARARGCGLVQLTTDKRRHDAHRFYERLGFVASHEGLKLYLD